MSDKNSTTNKVVRAIVGSSLLTLCTTTSQFALADAIGDALANGKASAYFRLRYEGVDQDNALKDASALTLLTRIGYTTGSVNNFSGTIEFENVNVVGGVNDYAPETAGYSVVADPETTEVNQAFLQYKNDMATVKYGRQVFTLDNHRFIGHVGWRQDRQTFDALSAVVTPVENLTVTYAYLFKRNRIFAETADIKSKDNIINASYKTPIGTLTGYGYFLEQDDASDLSFDTYGIRFTGAADMDNMKLLYTAEYASQKKDDSSHKKFDADYMFLEGGVAVSGITAKLGYEMLGSDNGDYGFSTPLATLHKFNGWADQFLGTPNEGLVDMYASVGGGLGGGKLTLVYHDFSADESSKTVDDLGSEVDVVYGHGFAKYYTGGIKYAAYSAGDAANGGAKKFVDTNKVWLWVEAKF